MEVDPDGITARIVPVPVPEARYSELCAVADGLAWLHAPLSGVLGEAGASPDAPPRRASLERFDLAKRECTELCAELDGFAVSGDGKWAVVRDHGDVQVIPAGHKTGDDGGESVSVDLTRARFREDPARLWRCAYDEAGRLMRRDFWVPDMSGVDWDGVLREYRPLLDRIRTASEFADLLEEVFGELSTSHAFVYPAETVPGQHPGGDLGKLGADLSPDADGAWRVDRVLPGESSDPLARSPLAAPGAAVRPGDVLVAVDGQPTDPVHGPAPLLADAAGKPVELTVRSGTAARRVAVVPLHSERRLRYQDWVAGCRRQVRELSDGRLGYLHSPDMMGAGWAHFSRDLRTEMHREGLIIDVRANGGGHISQLVLEKLAHRVIGWDVIRLAPGRVLPTGRAARPAGGAGQPERGLRRGHHHRGHPPARSRAGGRHPYLGWRDRFRRFPRTRGRHQDHHPAAGVLVRPARLGRGKLRRRPGRRGGHHAGRLGAGPRSAAGNRGPPRPRGPGQGAGHQPARPGDRSAQGPPAAAATTGPERPGVTASGERILSQGQAAGA